MKNTNTGTYLHKSAFSPTSHKTAAIRSLIFRALTISSSETFFEEAYEKIKWIFILNGYHYKFIEKIKNKIMRKINQPPLKFSNDEKTDIYWHLSLLKSTETSNSKVIDKINTILSPSIKLNVA